VSLSSQSLAFELVLTNQNNQEKTGRKNTKYPNAVKLKYTEKKHSYKPHMEQDIVVAFYDIQPGRWIRPIL